MPVTVEYDNTTTAAGGRGRNHRGLMVVIAVAALAIIAALVATRGPAGSARSGAAGPAGQNGSGLPRGPALAGAGGSRDVYGVPVGYRHDQVSAIEAAANYAVGTGSRAMDDPTSRHAINDTIYAASARAKATSDQTIADNHKEFGVNDAGQVLDPQTGQVDSSMIFVSDCYPQYGAYRLPGPSFADSVPVTIWMPCVDGPASNSDRSRLRTGWGRATLTMGWVDGDWRITDISAELGPMPQHANVPNVTFAERASLLRGDGWTLFANATDQLLPYPGAKLS